MSVIFGIVEEKSIIIAGDNWVSSVDWMFPIEFQNCIRQNLIKKMKEQ